MKFSLIITAFIFSSSLIFAQKDLGQTTVDAAGFFEKDWSIGINYGITQFDGDIRQYDYASSVQTNLGYQDSDFKELRTAFSFSLEKKINEKISFSIENVTGEFAGLRRPNEYDDYEIHDPYSLAVGPQIPGYGDKFLTSFNETDILLNYDINSNIAKLIKTELPENISVIVKMGFGYNVFRSLRTNLYTDEYVYSFGYDELTKNESDVVTETTIIYGAKIKYKIQDGLSLLVDYTVRNSMSDKWDSSIMDGGHGGDRFSLFSFGLAYKIPEKVKTKD
jgi:hypothetical protein